MMEERNCKFAIQVVSSQKLSVAAAGFLIGGESLAYRLDSTWKLIGGGGG